MRVLLSHGQWDDRMRLGKRKTRCMLRVVGFRYRVTNSTPIRGLYLSITVWLDALRVSAPKRAGRASISGLLIDPLFHHALKQSYASTRLSPRSSPG